MEETEEMDGKQMLWAVGIVSFCFVTTTWIDIYKEVAIARGNNKIVTKAIESINNISSQALMVISKLADKSYDHESIGSPRAGCVSLDEARQISIEREEGN